MLFLRWKYLIFDNKIYFHLLLLGDLDIEYLRINIEDTTDVPIKLSFPVVY